MPNTFKLMRNSVLVLISAFFLSCENPTDIDLPGSGNQGNSYFTDTLSLQVETFQMDSAITSNQAAALIGSYTDPSLGRVTAKAYLQPTLQQVTDGLTGQVTPIEFTFTSSQILDSVSVRLANKNLIFFGDSLANMTINVHRLNSYIDNTKNYNFNSSLPYDPTPLASVTFDRYAMDNDSLITYLNIKLPKSIGEELIALAGTDAAKDRDAFAKAFRGFVFVANNDAETVSVFNLGNTFGVVNSRLTLYYHDSGSTDVEEKEFEYTVGRFNEVTFDRSNTALAKLTNLKSAIPISETNGRTYLQAGSGIGTKIRFPDLDKLKSSQIGLAEITFSADTLTFSDEIPVAPFVTFIGLNADGSVKRTSGNYSYISSTTGALSGILSSYDDSLNVFTANITPYLQDISTKKAEDNGIALVVAIPASTGTSALVFNSGLNRIVLRNFKLNLYYNQ